jgi:molecular chaperone GrpE
MSRRRHDERERDERQGEPEAPPAASVAGSGSGDAGPDADGAGGATGASPEAPPSVDSVAELKDKWLRAKAELENVRRTARIETEQARRYGAGPVILSLLPVLDNLQRALAAPPASLDEDYLAGLRLIERQFLDGLAMHGITPVPAERGAPTDPSVHRALMEQDSDDVAPGRILLVAVSGYMLHDRLLREAQVIVARAPGRTEA